MKTATHIKSGKIATILSENHEMKVGNQWVPAVLFTCEGTDKTFSRTVRNFDAKFLRHNNAEANKAYEG